MSGKNEEIAADGVKGRENRPNCALVAPARPRLTRARNNYTLATVKTKNSPDRDGEQEIGHVCVHACVCEQESEHANDVVEMRYSQTRFVEPRERETEPRRIVPRHYYYEAPLFGKMCASLRAGWYAISIPTTCPYSSVTTTDQSLLPQGKLRHSLRVIP